MIWRTFLLCVQALWVHAQLTYPIPWWHPKIDTTLRYYPIPLAPANHPSINARCQQIVSRHGPGNHPRDYDDMIKAGTGYAGSNHPNVDRYFPQEAKPNTVISSVGALHPDVDAAYRAGKGYSLASHPSVAAFFQRTPDLLPAGHPNIDTLFSNPAANPLPAWHPELNQFLSYGPSVAITTVSAWHPNVDESYALGKGYSLSYHPSVMTLLNSMALLPNNHPNVDALFSNPAANPLPSWHPKLDGLLTRKAKVRIPLPGSHQNMDIAYRRGQAIPAVHPNVGQVFDGMLPAGHPDLNVLLQDPSAKPLPDWHPSLEAMVTRVNFGNPVAKAAVPADHPNIDSAYAARRPMPNTHPNVAALFSGILPASHPNVDTLLANPSANPLPAWHPTIENHVDRSGTGGADGSAGGVDDDDVGLVQVPAYHPGIDSSYQRGVAAPANHPKVQVLLASMLPPEHPNVDALLANPSAAPLPTWHPKLDDYVKRARYDPPSWKKPSLAWDHPSLEDSYTQGVSLPASHPSVSRLLAQLLPPGHPDVAEMLRAPAQHPLPTWHPNLDSFVVYRSMWSPGLVFSIIVGGAFVVAATRRSCKSWGKLRGRGTSSSVGTKMEELPALPRQTSAYDQYGKGEVPGAHPSLPRQPSWAASANNDGGLPHAGKSWAAMYVRPANQPAPRNMTVRRTMQQFANHRNEGAFDHGEARSSETRRRKASVSYIDPSGKKVRERGGSIFGVSQVDGSSFHPGEDVGFNFTNPMLGAGDPNAAAMAAGGEERREDPMTGGNFTQREFIDYYGGTAEWDAAAPQMQSQPTINPVSPDPVINVVQNDYVHGGSGRAGTAAESHRAAKAVPRIASEYKTTQWKATRSHAVRTRISCVPFLRLWNSGDLLFSVAYVVANVVAFIFFGIPATGGGFDVGRSLGSLAVANSMFLVVPATRNSVLTWFLGIPFDHVILHHRFLGRVTISLATAHGAWYFQELVGQHDNWVEYSNEMIYVTGFFSLFCGWVIAATTTNWFRRHYFNVFFWAHYSFIGFFALSYMHIRQAEPFLLAGIALYGVDKLIRSGSRLVPRRTLVFRNRGDSIAQVRFPKNPFTKLSGVHQVGQYMFVNFPELSLTEWHPFSVSSGPREPFVELHIRALGDHTRKIVALSKQCAKEGRLPLIRSEGPYGRLNFNMRRYGMLYLVGGGVGITPVIGILRDIFLSPPQPHVLKKVVVCWVLQHAKDVDTFLDVLQECTNHAKEFPDVLPDIDVRVHCTRARADEVRPPVYDGRPVFGDILDDAASGCFVRSTLIFACGPTRMIEQLWDMSTARNGPNTRVDFHHETFEF